MEERARKCLSEDVSVVSDPKTSIKNSNFVRGSPRVSEQKLGKILQV